MQLSDNIKMIEAPKNDTELEAERCERYLRIIFAFKCAGLDYRQAGIGAALYPPIGQTAVSAWRKSTTPSSEHIGQMAKLTDFNPNWLWTGQGAEKECGETRSTSEVLTSIFSDLDRDTLSTLLLKALTH